MIKLNNIPWKRLDFPKREMIKFAFEIMTAFGGREQWHINYHDFNVESTLLMFFRNNGIYGFLNDFNAPTFGNLIYGLAMHEDDDERYVVEVEYKDFNCVKIRFIKDDVVMDEWSR